MRNAPRIITSILATTVAAFAIPLSGFLGTGDGTPEGRKSLGGSGPLKHFSTSEGAKAAGIRIHGSRYGEANPPDEKFLIYFLNENMTEILHTEMAEYSHFERGDEEWVEILFANPFAVPETFWVALDFRAHRTKGVYVSYDTSTGGINSRTGLPGLPAKPVEFEGDWMIEIRVDTGVQV